MMGVPFDWKDPLRLQDLLTSEEILAQDMARHFSQEVLKPRAALEFSDEHYNPGIIKEFGGLGLLEAALPPAGQEYANYVTYGLIAREIERVDSGYRSAFSVQASLSIFGIHHFGTPAQRERFLPPLVAGDKIGCFGLTEPDHGSDPAGMETKARKTPQGWVLNGSKSWITHAPVADVLTVWARCDDGVVRGFLVERGMGGLSTPALKHKLSLRTSLTGMIVLDDVLVPFDNVLNVEGFKGPFECLNRARYGIIWGALGAAEDCWLTARDYVMERHQFGAPLAAKQLIQIKLADMQTEITLGLHGALRLGRLMESGVVLPEAISMMKRVACLKALAVARQARDMLGANGISGEYPVMRHLINLETVNTYEGTADIHGLILGKAQTGMAAF